MNCIYEEKMSSKGLTQSYGLEHNCNFNSSNMNLCDKCFEYAKEKQEIYFEKFEGKLL